MNSVLSARRISASPLLLILALGLGAFLLLRPQWLGLPGAKITVASVVILLWLTFALTTWQRHRTAQRALAAAMQGEPGATLVAYASQTGQAERYAEQTADALRAAGRAVRLMPLSHVDARMLAETSQALFVVSTTGEGDAPDNASTFVRHVLTAQASLAHLEYGLLALGDRTYGDYCGFARSVDHWLRHQKAQPLFDMIDVDNGDLGALRHWQHQLGNVTGHTALQDWSTPHYARWRLVQRTLMNAGSPGAPVFHLALKPCEEDINWCAGDIAEIGPCHAPDVVAQTLAALRMDGATLVQHASDTVPLANVLARSLLPAHADDHTLRSLTAQELANALQPLPHREYSIASLPSDGQVELLVRRLCHPDGTPGLGSGWLTQFAPQGADIAVRIRVNRNFHPPEDERPLILIGNGTGLAGLRAHIKARAAAGHHRNWLLFGERTAAHDQFFSDELKQWQAEGVLQRVDWAFSRDSGGYHYVQDCLRAADQQLWDWVNDGASIYVCGSLHGMAQAVTLVLQETLGADALEALSDAGRYRRDVY
jgi:sulfite reductase (NADPH) flavoprotein alpha-component